MTARDRDWLTDALAAFDLLHFDGALAEKNFAIKWFRFRTKGQSTRYGEYRFRDSPPMIRISTVLSQAWIPDYVVLDVVHHEALHAVVGLDHDLAFQLSEARYVHHAKAQMWCVANIEEYWAAAIAESSRKVRA